MMASTKVAVARCAILALLALRYAACGVQAERILVAPTPRAQSHLMNLEKIAEELITQRGHEIMFLMLAPDVKFLRSSNFSIVTYNMEGMGSSAMLPEWRISAGTPWAELWKTLNPLMVSACNGLMTNDTAIEQLKAFGADVMVAEVFTPCTALLANKLDLPWVNHWPIAPVEPFLSSIWAKGNRRLFQPNPLSYHPQYNTRVTTQRMSLWERLRNVLQYWYDVWDDWAIHRRVVEELYKRHGFNPGTPEEQSRQVLTIVPTDWAAEWLRPITPNFKMVGPVMSGPGKLLPVELEAFMTGAGEQGVLLASLGTIAEPDTGQLLGMAAAFASLPCKVLWRLTPKEIPDAAAVDELQLGNNTKVTTWVPQNDVLAHPNLRAFLSHAGINSMYEAIFHGKPVVAMPYFGDQPSNADRMVAKGFAVQLSPHQAGTPAFREALTEVLTDPKYRKAAQAMSRKIRARKNTPVQEAADWIEHVMATDGEPYLRMPDDEMSFAARYCLDVYAMLAACCFMVLLLMRAALGALIRKCEHMALMNAGSYVRPKSM